MILGGYQRHEPRRRDSAPFANASTEPGCRDADEWQLRRRVEAMERVVLDGLFSADVDRRAPLRVPLRFPEHLAGDRRDPDGPRAGAHLRHGAESTPTAASTTHAR